MWDLETGTEKSKLEGHSGTVYSVAINGMNNLVSGAADKTLR